LAVGRRRNTSSVRHRGDGTKTFGGLSVGHDLAVRCVDTGVVGIVGVTGFEDFILSPVGCIVSASNAVVDVLTIICGMGSPRITGLHAESIATHEVGPFDDLKVSTGPCG